MLSSNTIPTLCYNSDTMYIPSDKECMILWNKYRMFNNVKQHSLVVANFAEALAYRAIEVGYTNYIKSCRAGGLLHDIAKSYTVQYGGNHAQLGAIWVVCATTNYKLGQVILNHIEWIWDFPKSLVHPVFFVLYADKRVHNNIPVCLKDRYANILIRYGKTKDSCKTIYRALRCTQVIESILSTQLELPLYEYTLVGRRLVPRA